MTLGTFFKVKTKVATLKSTYNSLIISSRGCGYEVMGWDSSDVVIFDLQVVGMTLQVVGTTC